MDERVSQNPFHSRWYRAAAVFQPVARLFGFAIMRHYVASAPKRRQTTQQTNADVTAYDAKAVAQAARSTSGCGHE